MLQDDALLAVRVEKSNMDDFRHLKDFSYDRLPEDTSFRILELLPETSGDEVKYRLHLADWNDPPAYEAISYAWGDIDTKVDSICNDAILQITPNLRDCLHRLRYRTGSRWLWADAACIDQDNKDEQGHQVSHIRRIYEEATRVVVWLGEGEDEQAEQAIELATEIAVASCNRENFAIEDLKARDHICNMTLRVSQSDLLSASKRSLAALAWLFKRAWFSRLWVFQEVNCGRDVIMISGAREVLWDFVALAANYVRARPELARDDAFSGGYYENACIMRRRYLHAQSSVLHMFNSTKNFVTSDPLDRIYALMATPPFMKMDPPLEVDYRKTKRQLYEELAARCIHDDHDLGVLGYSLDGAEDADFPSWVPDWEKRNWEYLIDHPHGERLSASGRTCFRGSLEAGSPLIAQGLLFDVITTIERINIWDWFDRYGVALPRHVDAQSMSNSQELVLQIRRISTGELLQDPDHQSRTTVECIQGLLSGLSQYVARLLQLSKRDQAEIEVHDGSDSPGGTASYQLEPRSKSWDRTFLLTQNGSIGFGPKSSQPGDLICVLYGGKVPFVLRKVGEEHRLLGPAYVEGIMEGEAVESGKAEMLREQTFSIR